CLGQDAPVELQPAQLTVDIEGRMAEILPVDRGPVDACRAGPFRALGRATPARSADRCAGIDGRQGHADSLSNRCKRAGAVERARFRQIIQSRIAKRMTTAVTTRWSHACPRSTASRTPRRPPMTLPAPSAR